MPNPPPKRAENPRHLDPQGLRAERALLARAEFLSLRASQGNSVNMAFIIENGPDIESAVDMRVADEFRALATELHYW